MFVSGRLHGVLDIGVGKANSSGELLSVNAIYIYLCDTYIYKVTDMSDT